MEEDKQADSSLGLAKKPSTTIGSSSHSNRLQRSNAKSVLIVLTVTFAMILNLANNTSMSIAIPTIGREWNLREADLQWLLSAYPLSSGCLLLVFGRLADLHGRKKGFLYGTAHLAVFTLACGFSNNVVTLDILRAVQGIGAAATIPASLGILAHAFPPSPARSLAFATFSAGAPVGAVFGTAIGGLLTEFTTKTWRSPMFLQAGLTVLCFIGGLIGIDPDTPSIETDRRVDWPGAALVTAGLVLIVFVLSQGQIAPKQWATPYIIALLILGVILVALFILWQRYLENLPRGPGTQQAWNTPPPLMRLSLWKLDEGRFAVMMMIAFLNWCSFLAWTYWIQLYYQNYMKYTAMQAVVRQLPMFVSGVLCNIFVGAMASRVPLIFLVGVGTIATAGACILFAEIIPSASYWAFGFPAAVISVMGADLVFSAGTLYNAKVSLPQEQSVTGALFLTMTQLGTAVGVTVSTVVFNKVIKPGSDGFDQLEGYQAAQWTCFAFAMIALVLALLFFRKVGVIGHRQMKPSIGAVESGDTKDSKSNYDIETIT